MKKIAYDLTVLPLKPDRLCLSALRISHLCCLVRHVLRL